MSRMPTKNEFRQYRQQVPQPAPTLKRRRRRFRWWLIWVPAVLLLAAWIAKNIVIDFLWDDVMDALKVKNKERYTVLACLGLLVVAVVAIARILRGNNEGR